MSFTFDASTRRIIEIAELGNPSVVNYSLFSDFYVPMAAWWTGANLSINFPLRESGGNFRYSDNLQNPVYGPTDFFLQNQAGESWRIIPANYDHEIRFTAASLLAEDANTPLFDLTGITAKVVFRPDLSLAQAGYFLSGDGGTAGGSGGDATTANQQAIADLIGQLDSKVVELQDRLTPARADNLDELPTIAAAISAIGSKTDELVNAVAKVLSKVSNLFKGLGREPGVYVRQLDPTVDSDGHLISSDGEIRQRITLDTETNEVIIQNVTEEE